ncbi:MAG: response regulator [Geminicoccaceae bacterium]
MNILMVDDEPDAVTLFRQQFRKEIRQGEYRFAFAASADEALALLEGTAPPADMVILSDINMPGRSGLELLAEVHERWPAIPVVMITAYGDPDTETRALGLGAAAFLHKPVEFAALKALVRSGGRAE